MKQMLLLTLRKGSLVRDLPFDGSVQSMLWVSPSGEGTARNAVASVEKAENGVVLRAGKGMSLVVPGDHEVIDGPVMLEWCSSALVGLADASHEETMSLYVRPVSWGMATFRILVLMDEGVLEIGRDRGCGLRYDRPFVSSRHARLSWEAESFVIKDLRSGNGTLVNGVPLAALQPRALKPGDVVRILDLRLMVGRGFAIVNVPEGLEVSDGIEIIHRRSELAHLSLEGSEAEPEQPLLFAPAPHLAKTIRRLVLDVEAPPARAEADDQPVIFQLGPSLLMAMSSIFMASNSVSRIAQGDDVLTVMPSLAMALGMVAGSVVWPALSRTYERRQLEADRERSVRAYAAYLDKTESRMRAAVADQALVLRESRRPVAALLSRTREASPLLMSHATSHSDFMELRVGVGDQPLEAAVSWPHEGFSLEPDVLWDKVRDLEEHPPLLRDVPVACSFKRNPVVGVVGGRSLVWDFVRGLLVQICSLYSYEEVKVMLVAHEEERAEWAFLTALGHLRDDSDEHWLIALTQEGLVRMDRFLSREFDRRQKPDEASAPHTHFVVICAHAALARESKALRRLTEHGGVDDFSLIYMGSALDDLPRDCGYLIDLAGGVVPLLGSALSELDEGPNVTLREAHMFSRSDMLGTLVSFDPDIAVSVPQAEEFALALGGLRLGTANGTHGLPAALGFLELCEVGRVEHLNIAERWASNDASRTLRAPIGVDERGVSLSLDAHEDAHGPHGLVAGTTGSGKSEFLVTYILSLSVNYAPDEVAFVLIDYKGGGLAGTFSNERRHLPHLSGVITNLDGGLIRRSLVSLQAELRRRQHMLNQARDLSGETSVDIYRYLSLYRQGILSEPLPHLFVIADEFAELKQQEPEFMDGLMSAARIGRSLGVHLILATQKPSGVVNDQIWANSRFKVSLKVSDVADSRELLRRDEAAFITRPGEFRLLVGYDELYVAGQAAYAGESYVVREQFEPRRDTLVELLDAEGEPAAALRSRPVLDAANGTELEAVLAQLERTSHERGVKARPLWLDSLPHTITLAEVMERYGPCDPDGLVCVIGELDDPEEQRRRRFEVDLEQAGNVLLYGIQGSGVEGLLRCMVVSLALSNTADRLWVYGLDLGTGSLAPLASWSQVGGVVKTGDDEGMANLLRMLEREVSARKEGAQGGVGNHPRIVLAVTNLPALLELNQDWEEPLLLLLRDGPHFGVHIMATADSVGSVRMRMQTHFGQIIPTVLHDTADYISVLGELAGLVPPKAERRGLARVGKRVLEFQGVCLGVGEREIDALPQLMDQLITTNADGAPPIPRIPDMVTAEALGAMERGKLPVGMAKEDIAPLWLDLSSSSRVLLLGVDRDALASYLRGVYEAFAGAQETSYLLMDPDGVVAKDDCDGCVVRYADDMEKWVHRLAEGQDAPGLVVLADVLRVLECLSDKAAEQLKKCLVRHDEHPAFVVACESWRMSAVYEDWWRLLVAQGSGIWAGSGFSEQTFLRFPRILPSYRKPAGHADGFLVLRGVVTEVRLLEKRGDS